MSKQVTINSSFYKKMDQIHNSVKEKVWSKGEEIVSYAAAISPVKSGAYVESFSVVPRGAGGGRSRSSNNRPDEPDKEGKKMGEASRLRSEVRSIDPLEENGFTLRNRAPHANEVENTLKHSVFLRTKDRFR